MTAPAIAKAGKEAVKASAKQELGYFIRRSQVLQQYRQMVRAGRRYERFRPSEGADVMAQIKNRYRMHRDEADPVAAKQLITEGRRQLDLLSSLADDAAGGTNSDYKVGQAWPWDQQGGGQGRVLYNKKSLEEPLL